jgi:glycosyltransferase involved in cell wall biosynthesis
VKSILIIANSTHGGGAENSMMKLHLEFLAKGLKSTYLSLNLMEDGLDVYRRDIVQIGRRWSDGLAATLNSLKLAKNEISKIDPEIVIVNCELPELLVSVTKLNSRKIIVVEHTTRPWDGRRPMGVIVRLTLLLKRTLWVTVNSKQKRIWPTRNLATHIPNPISVPNREKEITKKQSAVFVGRLRPEKCPEMAMQASIESSTELSIIGDGKLRQELESQYRNSGLVRFYGYLDNPWSRISPESIVIVSSEYEGDGIVVLEAIQNGNPLLLRDIPDLRRFELNNVNYFKDQVELNKKLRMFRESPDTFRIPELDRDRILTPRAINIICGQWLAVFKSIFDDER